MNLLIKDLEKMLTLKDVGILTGKSEGFLKSKIASGELKKYDKYGNVLNNPIQTKGFFKLEEIKQIFDINQERKDVLSIKMSGEDYVKVDVKPKEIIKVRENSIAYLEKLRKNKFDVCLMSPQISLLELTKPFKFTDNVQGNSLFLKKLFEWVDKIYPLLTDNGSLLIHHIPRWLPYYASHLDGRMVFKYWITINSFEMHAINMFNPISTGILFMIKKNERFVINTIRESHKKCIYCGEVLKDYGGKKHLMHKKGAALSDVWKFTNQNNSIGKDGEYRMPAHLFKRLINLTCTPNSIVLLAPYNGVIKL